MRERELKLSSAYNHALYLKQVAPHAGARIETIRTGFSRVFAFVAPHAGARIETLS